jgi:hypothetical protein
VAADLGEGADVNAVGYLCRLGYHAAAIRMMMVFHTIDLYDWLR